MILVAAVSSILLLAFGFKQGIVETVEENMNSWTRFDYLFKKYGSISGVDWKILKAIALNESNLGNERSVARGLEAPTDIEGSKSFDGLSWGLMQVTLKTAKEFDQNATQEKLNNPEYSIELAAKYLARAQRQFSMLETRYLEWVIKSYNQGYGNTTKEKTGKIAKGYADEYWSRFQRNFERVKNG